ncbi:MAG: branched-chain amino acid ABC transporter permease [Gammaproteobacteria bacterium]|nr:branched-chain amino acid ABC transporter permease [Gammaproteobacteria bacterium]MCP5423519.1 branched-chain amino acid ABC transporter permease [Gammaproteobacteria bacterium]
MLAKLTHPRIGGLLILSLIIALLPLALPNNYYYDVAIKIGINAIVVVGLNLLIGYAGQISLGHGGFFGLGAYTSGILTAVYGWPPLLALLTGVAVVGVLSFIVARPILRLTGHYLAMATLGLGIIISIVISNEDWLTGGPDGMYVEPFTLLGWELYGEKPWYWVIGALLVISVWMAMNIVDSPAGRALRAVHGSEVAAQVVGVDTTGYKVLLFVVSAVFASVMGSLFAHYSGFITPAQAGFFHSIELVTMVVLGGMASTYGALVGAVLLTVLPQLLSGFEDFEMVIFGLILMLTLIFMPKGLVPTLTHKLKDWRGGRS